MPSMPLYGLGEIVSYGGYRWEIVSFEPDENKECWVYELKRVDGSDETESGIHELGLQKSFSKQIVEKPGSSIHTPKWDRCVEQVEASESGANAYAVCTAMLGSDAFKAMDDDSFEEKIKYYMQKLGIAGAGAVPNSLLAAQDLEETRKSINKTTDIGNFAVWYYDQTGARKCAVFGNVIDAEAYAFMVDSMGFEDVKIVKGQVEQTGKELKEAAEEAEEAETSEKKSLVENITAVQVKRQRATLAARSNAQTAKTFKDQWSHLNKNQN